MTTTNKPFIVKDDAVIDGNTDVNGILTVDGDLIVDNAIGRQFVIPSGTSLQRPNTPIKNTIRYSEDSEIVEIYNGTSWQSVASAGDAVNAAGAEEIALVQSIIFG